MKYFLKAHSFNLEFTIQIWPPSRASVSGGTFPYQEGGETRTRISDANFGAKSPQSPITETPPGASVKRNWYCDTIIS